MLEQPQPSGSFAVRSALLAFALGIALPAMTIPSLAQNGGIQDYGEVPGVEGKAQVTISVEEGNYATLIAVARASGGKPVGEGVVARAGVGVDIYVDGEICTADRDIRRQVDAQAFTGKFATSATCMTVLKPGTHVILAERTSINVEGAKMKLTYSVLGGTPSKSAP